jgi:hypothetical protein
MQAITHSLRLGILATALTTGLGLFGCGDATSPADGPPWGTDPRAVPEAELFPPHPPAPTHFTLVMGSDETAVGNVTLFDDGKSLILRAMVQAPWAMSEAHVCASAEPFAWTPPGSCDTGMMDPETGEARWITAIHSVHATGCGTVYLQVHAAITENGTKVGTAYAGSFRGAVEYTVGCDR